jgi:hypothetical protein
MKLKTYLNLAVIENGSLIRDREARLPTVLASLIGIRLIELTHQSAIAAVTAPLSPDGPNDNLILYTILDDAKPAPRKRVVRSFFLFHPSLLNADFMLLEYNIGRYLPKRECVDHQCDAHRRHCGAAESLQRPRGDEAGQARCGRAPHRGGDEDRNTGQEHAPSPEAIA